jgi:hypothetical protein
MFAPYLLIFQINPSTSLSFQFSQCFFLLLFFLFEIIYKIKNLFQLHPRSIFSFVKFDSHSFNCYLCNLR